MEISKILPCRCTQNVPDNILSITEVPGSSRQRSSSVEMMETAISGEEEVAAGVRVTEKRRLTQQQLQDDDSSASSSDEDAVVSKGLLLEEQRKNQQLRRRLQVLRKMHRRLQARHGRMEDVLLNMLASSGTPGGNCQAALHNRPARQSGNSLPRPATSQHTRLAEKPASVRVVPQRLPPKKTPSGARHDKEAGASVRQESALVARNNVTGASVRQESELGVQNDVSQEDPDPEPTGRRCASDTPGLFEEVGGRVHLGNGVFVSAGQWKWLLLKHRDSLFVKGVTKEVWGMDALHGRSVTGSPCNRFVNSRDMPKKRALSPKKLQAVGNAFDYYITQVEKEEPPAKRRSKMNSFIAELLCRR